MQNLNNIIIGLKRSMSLWQSGLVLLLAMLTVRFVSAQTVYVGGTLYSNRVFSGDTVYIVYQDLNIPQGIKLTIMPGSTIKVVQGRGVFVRGSLQAGLRHGTQEDSIRFMAYAQQNSFGWNWKGIIFKNVTIADSNFLIKTVIRSAEVAVEIFQSEGVAIINSSFFSNQNLGVKINDSRFCTIAGCNFLNNYNGIELTSEFLHKTSDNLIAGNFLKNENQNIYIFREGGSVLSENVIKRNIIEGANNGVWMDNGDGIAGGKNTIEQNVFFNNGAGVGYALFLSQDSISVKNNIFWKNNIAVYSEENSGADSIIGNSFYKNNKSVILYIGSTSNFFLHNTFTQNKFSDLEILGTGDITFSYNNIIPRYGVKNLVANTTFYNLNIANNYWNSTTDSLIDELIWDKNDKSILGELNYKPFLNAADTVNPVSPPYLVKKQLVNGNVLLTWLPNQEADLKGYNVYYGKFTRYRFSDSLYAGNDTSFVVELLTVSDTFALTAIDSVANFNDARFRGHESPYAFAVLYPYAGKDTLICKYQTAFKITGSNIPFSFDEIKWTSDGDGYFEADSVVRPVYHYGILDVQNGGVNLTMSVLRGEDWLDDRMYIRIMDNPVADAGGDTTIFDIDSAVMEAAYAENYQYVIWQSTGDGLFVNDTVIRAVYKPGHEDIKNGEVSLVFYVYSQCGFAVDTLKLNILSAYSVQGKLWWNNQNVIAAVVLAIKQGDTSSRAINIVRADNKGSFAFKHLSIGNYYLYAVPDTSETNKLPAYYVNQIQWQEAYLLQVDADVYDVDLQLSSPIDLPKGEGSISGFFELPSGANLNKYSTYLKSWFSSQTTSFLSPTGLPNMTIFLTDTAQNRIFRFVLTDSVGNFSFRDLPYGNYNVVSQLTNHENLPSPVITLSPQHKHESGVNLKIEQYKIGIHLHNNIQSGKVIAIYPNPAHNYIWLPVSVNTGDHTVLMLFNVFGQRIANESLSSAIQGKFVRYPLSIQLPQGLYFGKLFSGNFTWYFRFVKH